MSHAWAKLVVTVKAKRLIFEVKFRAKSEFDFKKSFACENLLGKGLHANVYFFPRRKGLFAGIEAGGKAAKQWVNDNVGVAIIDHGFRMMPYGEKEDDWLAISTDKASNSREWRSKFMEKYYPIPMDSRNRPAFNPALYLPGNHQLVGAVFVESSSPKKGRPGLVPAMDRLGFIENEAFEMVTEVIRAGVELLGYLDAKDQEQKKREQAKAYAAAARKDIALAISRLKKIPTLSDTDKTSIINSYTSLSKRIDEVESYHENLRQNLDQMGLLGAVAGFTMIRIDARSWRGLAAKPVNKTTMRGSGKCRQSKSSLGESSPVH